MMGRVGRHLDCFMTIIFENTACLDGNRQRKLGTDLKLPVSYVTAQCADAPSAVNHKQQIVADCHD